jgi:hypothetical protein
VRRASGTTRKRISVPTMSPYARTRMAMSAGPSAGVKRLIANATTNPMTTASATQASASSRMRCRHWRRSTASEARS